MKKAKIVPAKKPIRSQLELRRWCIEQASRWPTETRGSHGGSFGGGYSTVDSDLIGRAEKILAWVTK